MPIQSHSQYGGRRSQWEIARQRTRFMIQVTMLCAIQVVMMVVPFLGFIPLGPINATTLHLPVVVAGTVLGVKGGAIVGLCFGLISFLRHSFIAPGPLSFLFTPLAPGGNIFSLVIAIVPRVLLGVFAALIFKGLKGRNFRFAPAGLAGLLATLLHTVMVLGGIYLFFGPAYAEAQGISMATVIPFLMGIVATNGIAEALIAMMVNAVLARVLIPMFQKR